MSGKMPVRKITQLSPKEVVTRQSTQAFAYPDELICRAIAYIRENACAKLGVETLSRKMNVTSRTLNRRFVKTLGFTPQEAIQRARLNIAHGLVLGSNRPLSQIAIFCGYADQSHFSRDYRKIYGEPPVHTRRRNTKYPQIYH